MLQLYQVAYGLFISLVLLVVAVLSLTGVAFSAYSGAAMVYVWAFVIVGALVGFRFFFGNQPFDSSQGLWHGATKVVSQAIGGEQY
jgi:hypothetical protein